VVGVSIADYEPIGVGDGQWPSTPSNSIVDTVTVCTQYHAPVAVFYNHFIGVLQILTDQKPDSATVPMKQCQDRWSVRFEVSALARTLVLIFESFLPSSHLEFVSFAPP